MEFKAVVVLSLAFTTLASANEFLRMSSRQHAEYIGANEIRASLLKEIETSLPEAQGQGSRLTTDHSSKIEDSLRPIFDSLPKNEFGRLPHTVARYALHRFFVLRHGWSIKGLQPSGGMHNASSPAMILKDQVPSYVQDVFEQRIGAKGFNLHELAILASTVAHLIQEETVQRLSAAFNIFDAEQKGILSNSKADQMLDAYIMSYIVGENLATATLQSLEPQVAEMPQLFNHWDEAKQFVRTLKQNAMQADPSATDSVGFGTLTTVASATGEHFGEFLHDKVCKGLKAGLMDREYRDTGRVKLSAFYKPALDGNWQFQESTGYLRELGVLEEIDGKEPSVLVANYLVAPANCLAPSGFYSVCCRNECDGLLEHLEHKLAAPEATPEAIVALIENLPSDTIAAPRTLPQTLLARLGEIASGHGGTVPLHGRLFAQWMHHAYPRECPYPHISGTTSPKLPEEWLEASGIDFTASEEEMLQYVQWSGNESAVDASIEDLMAWSPEEELLVLRSVGASLQSPSETPATKKSIGLFALAGLLASALIHVVKVTSSGTQAIPEKFII